MLTPEEMAKEWADSDPLRLYCVREALRGGRRQEITWEKAYQEIQELVEHRDRWRAQWRESEANRRYVTRALGAFHPHTGAPLRATFGEPATFDPDVTWPRLIKAIEMLRGERDSLAAAVASQEFHEDFNGEGGKP